MTRRLRPRVSGRWRPQEKGHTAGEPQHGSPNGTRVPRNGTRRESYRIAKKGSALLRKGGRGSWRERISIGPAYTNPAEDSRGSSHRYFVWPAPPAVNWIARAMEPRAFPIARGQRFVGQRRQVCFAPVGHQHSHSALPLWDRWLGERVQGTGARAGLGPLFALDFSQRRPAPRLSKKR